MNDDFELNITEHHPNENPEFVPNDEGRFFMESFDGPDFKIHSDDDLTSFYETFKGFNYDPVEFNKLPILGTHRVDDVFRYIRDTNFDGAFSIKFQSAEEFKTSREEQMWGYHDYIQRSRDAIPGSIYFDSHFPTIMWIPKNFDLKTDNWKKYLEYSYSVVNLLNQTHFETREKPIKVSELLGDDHVLKASSSRHLSGVANNSLGVTFNSQIDLTEESFEGMDMNKNQGIDQRSRNTGYFYSKTNILNTDLRYTNTLNNPAMLQDATYQVNLFKDGERFKYNDLM